MDDLRQACDRCHGKKLRCSKPPGSSTCGRCDKAGAVCVFSPPARPGRLETAPPEAMVARGAFEWATLGVFTPVADGSAVASESADQACPSDVSQLADIMTALDCIHGQFPSRDLHHIPVREAAQLLCCLAANFDLQSLLERLLHQAQRLTLMYAKVLQSAARQASLPHPDEACAVADCMHRLREPLQTRLGARLDSAMLQLLMANHQRLLDIFDTLVDHARLCAQLATVLPDLDRPSFVPEIRIGSFVAPRASAASILLSTVIELLLVLTNRSGELANLLSSLQPSPASEMQILNLQTTVLCDRSQTTLHHLRMLRDSVTDVEVGG